MSRDDWINEMALVDFQRQHPLTITIELPEEEGPGFLPIEGAEREAESLRRSRESDAMLRRHNTRATGRYRRDDMLNMVAYDREDVVSDDEDDDF